MAFVLDASIALSWCFEDESDAYADRVISLLDREAALVPSVWALEVANVLIVQERRGRLVSADVDRFAVLLQGLPISLEETTVPGALGPVTSLARRLGLTSYDASYLELAIRRGVPLATQDVRLRQAADAAGVSLVE